MHHAFARSLKCIIILFAAAILTPASALACACGCGVFDVSTSSMLPTSQGGMVFGEFDFMNQDRDWSGSSRGIAANNTDKDLKSLFYTAGIQYMWSRSWGMEVDVPYTQRHFTTDTTGMGDIQSFNKGDLGDIRLQAIYSGFEPDMSTGVTFGLKLPTGDDSFPGFDRDTAIGSGSTDVLLGAYHMGNVTKTVDWYGSARLDQPVLTTAGYRPGTETDGAIGVYYNSWYIGNVKISPIAQAIVSYRLHDTGPNANPDNSGYERLLLSPGIEADMGSVKLYGDAEIPVYQHVNGDQLVASPLLKVVLGYKF